MPVREGVETIREIKHEHPHAKIIAISGGGRIGNSDLLKMAHRIGADRILAKPFDLDELTGLVRDSLGG